MATGLAQKEWTTEQLLDALERMNAADREWVARKALQLNAQQDAQSQFQRETELLKVIFQKKPAAFRRRFDRLQMKRRALTLTSEEHKELLQMVEEVRVADVRYVEALTELARLRNVSLPDLMQQLGISAS